MLVVKKPNSCIVTLCAKHCFVIEDMTYVRV